MAAVLLEDKNEGMGAEAIACHSSNGSPISRMKSELPERLLPSIERAQKIAPRSTGRVRRKEAAA